MMLDRSFVSSTRLQESNFVHNLMNNLVQYVNYTSLDLNLERFSSFHLALMIFWTEWVEPSLTQRLMNQLKVLVLLKTCFSENELNFIT